MSALTKSIKVPQHLTRAAKVLSAVDETEKTVRLSISSDEPYLRYDWWNDEEYYEVLDHSPGGIDDERLKAGLPILFNHDRDAHLGRAKSYEIKDGKCEVVAKFSESPLAQEKFNDVKAGILVDTSVGYEILGEGICTGAKDGKPIYKFRFKVYEGSLVTIPADASVGVGRQRDNKPTDEPREILIKQLDNQPALDNKRTTPQPTPPTTMTPEEIAEQKRKHEAAVKEAGEKAIAEHKKKCKAIDEYVASISGKNPAWGKAAAKIAEKHKEGEANFEDFRTEANTAFVQPGHVDAEENEGEQRQQRFEAVGERRSAGQMFVESPETKAALSRMRGGRLQPFGVDIPGRSFLGARAKMVSRAGFTSSDLSGVNVTVNSQILPLGTQRLTILDVIGAGSIATGSYKYARENSFGTVDGVAVAAGAMPRAKAVGERGLKPLWEPDLTVETANVCKVAITAKVPDEFLADFPSAMTYIDGRMPFMVDTETEFEVLYGDGLNDTLKGIFNTGGVQTRVIEATNDRTVGDSLKKGLTDVEVNAQFEPDFYGFHPYDWETASLLKDAQGRYLMGGPFYIPLGDGLFVERYTLWGKPVVKSTAIAYGFPICGAGKIGAAALMREGMRIEMTNSNEDDFRKNLVCLRAEHRLALPVYRPVAFLQFTGFPARV